MAQARSHTSRSTPLQRPALEHCLMTPPSRGNRVVTPFSGEGVQGSSIERNTSGLTGFLALAWCWHHIAASLLLHSTCGSLLAAMQGLTEAKQARQHQDSQPALHGSNAELEQRGPRGRLRHTGSLCLVLSPRTWPQLPPPACTNSAHRSQHRSGEALGPAALLANMWMPVCHVPTHILQQ